MDDERIGRALREGPPDEPRYVPSSGRAVSTRRRRSRVVAAFAAAATPAIIGVVIVGLVLTRLGRPTLSDGGSDLLADLRGTGVIRIAVTRDAPQVDVPGTGYDGFDIDVARAIATRLGLTPAIDIVDPAVIEAGSWTGR